MNSFFIGDGTDDLMLLGEVKASYRPADLN